MNITAIIRVSYLCACTGVLLGQTRIAKLVDVSNVPAAAVGVDLLTHNDRQYVTFYDAEGNPTVASRRLDSRKWERARLPSAIARDRRTPVIVAVDAAGYVFLSGDACYRATRPADITTLERVSDAGSCPTAVKLEDRHTRVSELEKVESPLPGMKVCFREGRGSSGGDARYILRWEALEAGHERPKVVSMLRVYEIRNVEHTRGAFGQVVSDRNVYRPLDTVKLTIRGRASGDTTCRIRVADPEQNVYLERDVPLKENRGETEFTIAGLLGNHYVYLSWPDRDRYSRYLNLRLEAATSIESGDADFDGLYPFTRDKMLLGRREYDTPSGKFVGYMSADTAHFDGIWLRDSIYQLGGYKHWEREMTCGLDRFLEAQSENGQVPDGIERAGKTWRVGLESDVEAIVTLGVWQTWQVMRDDAWLAAALPKVERALHYITSDPKHWDPVHRLVKRQHSCDTWDYDIDGASDTGLGRHVIAVCDQSAYVLAFRAMADMYRHLGKQADAERWEREYAGYRERAQKLLWDGTKFLHHVHIDTIDHGDFDERQQLAMGNTWAMTRGLATPEQGASIVDEYRRRYEETGDAYPWWSLQPGYPDYLGYWKEVYRRQGAYANGGLMPWVGGELCRGAFLSGRETYAVELIRQWADHLRRTGGAHVWYWPNGEAGLRTTNEVNNAGWGMAQWLEALMEGLVGIGDDAEIAPRWSATPVREVRAVYKPAVGAQYAAYRMRRGPDRVELDLSGSRERVRLRVLLPSNWNNAAVRVDGRETDMRIQRVDRSSYASFECPGRRAQVVIERK